MPNTQAFGLYPAEGTAGDQVSSTGGGRHVTVTAAELLTSAGSGVAVVGLPCVFGIVGDFNGVGVCFTSGTLTDLIAIETECIRDLSVVAFDDDAASVVRGGELIYINKTDGILSKRSAPATQLAFGYALGQIASGDTAVIAVRVHWDPLVATVLEVRGTPGDGIVFASVGKSGNPLVYAAASDKAMEVWAKFTLATEGGFYAIEADVAYEPIGDSGWASPVGVVGRVTLKDGVTHTGGQSGLEGVRGQLAFEDTSVLDQHNAIYSGLRGVLTGAGTPVFTDFGTLACLYCDNLCSVDMAGISTYFTEFGAALISLQNHGGTMDHAIVIRGGNKITDVFAFSSMGGAIDAGTKGGAGTHMKITVDGTTKYINIYGG